MGPAMGCSLLYDFPEEGTTSGSGGSGGGGGGPTICAAFAPVPTLDRVAWRGEMVDPGVNDELATTGLARDTVHDVLYAYGRTRGGIGGLFTGSGRHASELYLTAIPDQGTPTLAMAARMCADVDPAFSGRVTTFLDGRAVVSGSLGFDFLLEGPGTWSIGVGDADQCATGVSVPYDPDWNYYGGAPFFALVDETSVSLDPLGVSDGGGVDVDDRDGRLAAIGVGAGQLFEQSTPDPYARYFVQRSTETSGNETFILDDHFARSPSNFVHAEAGVAVDEQGNAWFGGGSCNDGGACNDQGAFLGVLRTTGAPELIVERPGTASAVTAMAEADGTVLIGGRYDGELSMLGATLGAATSTDAFVIAMDSTSRDVLWTYPGATPTPGYDVIGHNALVDLAVLGTRDCGAVYLVGCTVPSTETNGDCAEPKVGKRGFIVKLDLGTGRELWVDDVALENPDYDLFLPTAIAAQGDHVWVAATASGKVDVAGTQVIGASPMETLVLTLSP